MAFIPLADIPNLGPVGSSTVLAPGNQQAPNLAGAAQSLLAPEIQQGAFDGEALAAQNLAQGVRSVAKGGERVQAVLSDWNRRQAEFQDKVSLATLDGRLATEFEKYKGEMVGKPESEWQPGWPKKYESIYPQLISDLKFSGAGRQELEIYTQGFLGKTNAELISSANRSAVERGTGILLAKVDRDYQAGNTEGAEGALAALVATGAMRQDQAEARKRAHQEQTQEGEISAAIVNNPRLVQEDMEAALKSDKAPEQFPWMTDKSQMRIYRDRARAEGNNMEVEARQEATDLVLGGKITDIKQLRQQFGDRLPERAFASLEKSLAKEITYNPETVSKIRTKIASADFSNDLEMKSFNEIANELDTQVPERLRGPLSSELYQTWSSTVKDQKSKTPEQEFTSSLMREIDKFADQGLLMPGGTGYGTKKGETSKIIDPEQHSKVWEKAEMIKGQMRDWLKANPSANPAAARQQFMDLIGPSAADAAKAPFEQAQKDASWGIFEWTMPGVMSKPLRDEVRKRGKQTVDDLNADVDAELSLPNSDDDPNNIIPQ